MKVNKNLKNQNDFFSFDGDTTLLLKKIREATGGDNQVSCEQIDLNYLENGACTAPWTTHFLPGATGIGPMGNPGKTIIFNYLNGGWSDVWYYPNGWYQVGPNLQVGSPWQNVYNPQNYSIWGPYFDANGQLQGVYIYGSTLEGVSYTGGYYQFTTKGLLHRGTGKPIGGIGPSGQKGPTGLNTPLWDGSPFGNNFYFSTSITTETGPITGTDTTPPTNNSTDPPTNTSPPVPPQPAQAENDPNTSPNSDPSSTPNSDPNTSPNSDPNSSPTTSNDPNSDGPDASCFVQGTLISNKNGFVPIEEINSGDEIYTYDVDAKSVVLSTVREIIKAEGDQLFVLDFGSEIIRCTKMHKFYTGEWKIAMDLSVGDRILDINGGWNELKKIQHEIKLQPVYNLHVNQNQNYFVGKIALLVHNQKEDANNDIGGGNDDGGDPIPG